MKKTTQQQTNVWGDEPVIEPASDTVEQAVAPRSVSNAEFDMEGLMTDFPTAKELEQFVYDQTGIILNLKGRANKLKYQIALDTLNGKEPEAQYVHGENPYLDKNELIPEEPVRPIPARDATLPDPSTVTYTWHQFNVPHPDYEMRAVDAKVVVEFKTYQDGSISYQTLGPLEKHSIGEKLDKYGRSRPEKFVWVDPRTGEQTLRTKDGQFSKTGRSLYAYCKSQKVNKTSSVWDMWIDRDVAQTIQGAVDNPWA